MVDDGRIDITHDERVAIHSVGCVRLDCRLNDSHGLGAIVDILMRREKTIALEKTFADDELPAVFQAHRIERELDLNGSRTC